ncbi:MAG: hypothetical protein ACREEP_09175 [Dongiaceae bacterium]
MMNIPIRSVSPIATDNQIEHLVASFHARIRRDPELGPIFRHAMGEDRTGHLKAMCDGLR